MLTQPPESQRPRPPLWRIRRPLFVLFVAVGFGLAVAAASVDEIEFGGDEMLATSYICSGEVVGECNRQTAINELSPQGQTRVYAPYSSIPRDLINAILATEDQRFFDHNGVDLVGVGRAVVEQGKNRMPGASGSKQGGSTITQQYVKLVSGDDDQTVRRKLREIIRAIRLERKLLDEAVDDRRSRADAKDEAKRRLLEDYLNRVWFGRRSYGVEAAALNYFDKSLADLTLAESAYLAGLIRNPSPADHTVNPAEAERRRNATLDLMYEAGHVTAQERRLAKLDDWSSLIKQPRSLGLGDVVDTEYGTDYFVAAVHNELDRLYPDGFHHRNGVRVYTTLNRKLQRQAHAAVTNMTSTPVTDGDRADDGRPPVGLISIDADGRVAAMIGGFDWSESQVNAALGPEGGNAGHPAGSLLMPVVMATYLEQGNPPETTFGSPPRLRFWWGGLHFEVFGGGDGGPSDRTVHDAVVHSSNTAMVQVLDEASPPSVAVAARELGVRSPLDPAPTLVLGFDDVSVIDVAALYAAFDRGGRSVHPVLIERIENASGEVLCWYPTEPGACAKPVAGNRPRRKGDRVVSSETAKAVNRALVDVVDDGTGRSAGLVDVDGRRIRAAGKTASSVGYNDAWFVGSACELTTAVWMGSSPSPGTVRSERASPSERPMSIWRSYYTEAAHSEALDRCHEGG